MNTQLAPGALLITLAWPIHPTRAIGPPYAVDAELEAYARVLGGAFERVLSEDLPGDTMAGRVEGATAKIAVWRKVA